jgi:hypothetical protein
MQLRASSVTLARPTRSRTVKVVAWKGDNSGPFSGRFGLCGGNVRNLCQNAAANLTRYSSSMGSVLSQLLVNDAFPVSINWDLSASLCHM